MKKLLILITCMVVSHAFGYTWKIHNKASESIDIKVDSEIPAARKDLIHFSATLAPNETKITKTGWGCVYQISASLTNNPEVATIWYPAVLWECPGRTITVTNDKALKITVH